MYGEIWEPYVSLFRSPLLLSHFFLAFPLCMNEFSSKAFLASVKVFFPHMIIQFKVSWEGKTFSKTVLIWPQQASLLIHF